MKTINRTLKVVNIVLVTLLILFLSVSLVSAQGNSGEPLPPPSNGCNDASSIFNPHCDPEEVPLTGLEYLMGAGILYAVKKLGNKKDSQ